MRKSLYRLLLLLLLVVPLILVSLPVYATIGDPDSITLESVRVFQNIWEDGDMLALIEYKVMYDPDPEEDPNDTYLVGVWDSTVKGPDRPLDYYQHNITSVYVTSAEVTSFGYELYDTLKVRVMGNPTHFPVITEGVNMSTVTLTSSHWISGTMEESRVLLGARCIYLAEILEASWSTPEDPITLLTSGDKLNATGTVKFKEAIPGLDGVCPDIFQEFVTYPEYEEPTYEPEYEETLMDRAGPKLQEALEGIGKLATGKEGLGPLFGGVGLAILYFILAGRLFVATGSVPTAMVVSIPFLFAGNMIGLLPLAVTFIASFIIAVIFGVTFIVGRF